MAEHPKLFIFINELRKSFRNLLVSFVLCSFGIFFLSPRLLQVVQGHLADKLYFFAVAEPFLAHVKLAFFAALFLLMPYLTIQLWRALGKPFNVSRGQLFFFIFFTCLLFYGGTIFCYLVTLPFGIEFLLGFGSEELKPVISVSRFVNFITIFILAFGLIFELPIFMVFSVKVGALKRNFYEKNRRYALLFIAFVAALLTPTPDIVNMMLMGGPLYLLYESGIIILRVLRIGKTEPEPETKTP
ncbi:MAG TPA: preprotein translocase subunit TatC [Desulfobulbaceae bacterium]|nr:preprotein translocase subunit TatC [Desulfobulbaceae bacterium]